MVLSSSQSLDTEKEWCRNNTKPTPFSLSAILTKLQRWNNFINPEGVTIVCLNIMNHYLSIQSPLLCKDVFPINTFQKAFKHREEFIVSLVVCWSNHICLNQFSLTSSSSASSSWFWCATARLGSLLTKDLAEFFEHHQHNLGFHFFILFLKEDSL